MTIKRLDPRNYNNLMGTSSGDEINQTHLILGFLDFDFDPALITEKIGLEPLSVGRKGDTYFIGPQKDIPRTRECSHWDYERNAKTNEFAGDLIANFCDEIIRPRVNAIKEIGLGCEITRFTVVQYFRAGRNPGFCFEKEQIEMLANIGAEIDMDIYCLADQ